ncbi:MAG: TolC family protein [candidate division Zixibacteria bacterium]|nr:TolC family protein [candidate division Zixibacteria bacterium]
MKNRLNRSCNFVQFRRLAPQIAALLIMAGLAASSNATEPARPIRLGYFEGGQYIIHSRLRDEYLQQLEAVLPGDLKVVFAPEGYRSAEWNRDNSRRMAKELSELATIDIIIAVGPWVVNDLIEAGCKKPIVAMHQFAPDAEGLLDASGKPVVENLTIHLIPDKIENDLAVLNLFRPIKKLGFLHFPSGDESAAVLARVEAVGQKYGFEVVTAEGYDNKGTFAYFKAYKKLDRSVDAIYLPPLWGLDVTMVNQFFLSLKNDRIPAIVSEGRALVERGALATNSAYNVFSEARFNAYKTFKIITGSKPAELTFEFVGGNSVAVNEKTAKICRVPLSRRIYNEADVILAGASEDAPLLTLDEAILRAVSLNPGFLAMSDALEAAGHAAAQAYAEYLPHLSLSARLGYRDDNTVSNSRNEFEQEYFATSLDLHQKLFSLETIRSIKVASKEKELEQVNLESARIELERAVERAFFNYVRAEKLVDIFSRIRQLVDRNIEVSGTRQIIEDGDEYELWRWQQERYKISQKIIESKANLEIARILLNTVLNYPNETEYIIYSEAFSEEATSLFYDRVYAKLSQPGQASRIAQLMVEYALDHNSQIRQLEQKLSIMNGLRSQNKSRYLPSLEFRASYRYADELRDTPPSFKEEKGSWTLGTVLKFPLFLGTDRIKEGRKLSANFSRLEFETDNQRLKVTGRIFSRFQKMTASLDMLPSVYRRLDLARLNLETVIKRYDAGKLNIINLLDAQDELTDAELNEIMVRMGFYETLSDLVGLLGFSTSETGTAFTNRIEQFFNQ